MDTFARRQPRRLHHPHRLAAVSASGLDLPRRQHHHHHHQCIVDNGSYAATLRHLPYFAPLSSQLMRNSCCPTGNDVIEADRRPEVAVDWCASTSDAVDDVLDENETDSVVEDGLSGSAGEKTTPIGRRRNARERDRVRTINSTFARLRQKLPHAAAYSRVADDAGRGDIGEDAATSAYRARKLSKVSSSRGVDVW